MTPGRTFGLFGWGAFATLTSGLVFAPSAHAHARTQGMGDFSGGLLHPLLTPAHLLILIGLGLWVGQRRPLQLRSPVMWFAPFSAAGLLLTTQFQMPMGWQAALPAFALGIALLVAIAARLPPRVSALIFACSGLMVGLDSGLDGGGTVIGTGMTLLGTWISLNLCLANIAFYTSICPQHKWVQTGIRVAGSWIAAICLLVLAFALQTQARG